MIRQWIGVVTKPELVYSVFAHGEIPTNFHELGDEDAAFFTLALRAY
jgi:hypothetical protein